MKYAISIYLLLKSIKQLVESTSTKVKKPYVKYINNKKGGLK